MAVTAPTVSITEPAAKKVVELLERETDGSPEHAGKEYALRIAVQPGGCAGLRYALYFDDRKMEGDLVSAVEAVPPEAGVVSTRVGYSGGRPRATP